jgi:superoxide dismutase, Fe-Mn family
MQRSFPHRRQWPVAPVHVASPEVPMTDAAALATRAQFTVPPLPYDYGALAPTLSDETMRTHHDKHHAAYVDKLNGLLAKGKGEGRTIEQVIRRANRAGEKKVFNNAAQAWNHGFFWHSMTPDRASPGAALAAAIERDFGSVAQLGETLVKKGTNQFGSGWVWLVARGKSLEVVTTHDAGTPITDEDVTPLLTCDVWEHAYYLDYKQARDEFLGRWFETLANWQFADAQYAAASGTGEAWSYPPPEG